MLPLLQAFKIVVHCVIVVLFSVVERGDGSVSAKLGFERAKVDVRRWCNIATINDSNRNPAYTTVASIITKISLRFI